MKGIAKDLIAYVHAILNEKDSAVGSLSETSTPDQVAAFVVQKTEVLCAVTERETDIEGCFKLLLKLSNLQYVQEIVEKLIKDQSSAVLKLRM